MKILFYSKYCKHCSKLFTFKENDEDFQKVKKVCVDNDNNLPPQITKVPTLVADDLQTPIYGKEVFAYFNCLDMFFQKTNNINYWQDKALKRPVVDNFIPGKEQALQYQPIADELRGKNNIDLNKIKKDREIN
jgi:hypothetical protein